MHKTCWISSQKYVQTLCLIRVCAWSAKCLAGSSLLADHILIHRFTRLFFFRRHPYIVYRILLSFVTFVIASDSKWLESGWIYVIHCISQLNRSKMCRVLLNYHQHAFKEWGEKLHLCYCYSTTRPIICHAFAFKWHQAAITCRTGGHSDGKLAESVNRIKILSKKSGDYAHVLITQWRWRRQRPSQAISLVELVSGHCHRRPTV